MGDETVRFGLCYLRARLEPSIDNSLVMRHELGADEFEVLAEDLSLVRQAARRPMLEVIEGAHSAWSLALETLSSRRDSRDWESSKFELDREARVATFAAVNAVYAFQEHALASASREGGPTLRTAVNDVFRDVYASNLPYLYAYKLRQVFVHDAIKAVVIRDRSSLMPDGSVTQDTCCVVASDDVRERMSGDVGAWLDQRSTDIDLFDLLESSLLGMDEVFSRTRELLFPQLAAALDRMSKWRLDLLNGDYPMCLARLTYLEDRVGPIKLTGVDPDDLRRVGVAPLSMSERASSSRAALEHIERVVRKE